MENNRGQSIFLSVVGIATLLVAIVGATFAYFSITVSGNENASSINITTAKLGAVTYSDGAPAIQVTDAYPGYQAKKTFTVSTAGADSSSVISYSINLVTTDNELPSTAQSLSPSQGSFTYTLTPTTHAGGEASAVSATNMPNAVGTETLATGTLTGNMSHTYDFEVTLEETNNPQNDLQGLSYAGIIQIVVTASNGEKRTWDNTYSSWVPWSSQS